LLYSIIKCIFKYNHLFILKSRDLPLEDTVSLQAAMVGLALKCYPDNLDYVDKSLQTISDTFAKRKIEKYVLS